MANLIQSALQKIRDTATSLGKTVVNATPFADPTANNGNNFWGNSSVAQGMGNVQRTVQQAPQFIQNVGSQVQKAVVNPSFNEAKTRQFVSSIQNPIYNTINKIPDVPFAKFDPLNLSQPVKFDARPILKGGLNMLAGQFVGPQGEIAKPFQSMNRNEQVNYGKDLAMNIAGASPGAIVGGTVVSTLEAGRFKKMLPEIRNMQKLLSGNKELDLRQYTALEDLVKRVSPMYKEKFAQLLGKPSELKEYAKSLLAAAEDQALHPNSNIGLSVKNIRKDAQAGLYNTKLYHGTDAKFDNFDFKKTGLASGEKPVHGLEGTWFTNNKSVASGYGKNIKEAKVDTSNFHVVDAKGATLNDFRDELWDAKKYVKDNNKSGLVVKNLVDNKDWAREDVADHIFVVDKKAINVAQQPLSKVTKGSKMPTTELKTEAQVSTKLGTPQEAELLNRTLSTDIVSPNNSIHLKSISDGERQIDDLLETGGMATGNWKQDYYFRQKAIDEIKSQAPPEVVAQVEKIQSAIDDMRSVREEIQNAPNTGLSEAKLQSEYKRLEAKLVTKVKGLDKLKLDPKYFQIGRDELGRPQSVSVTPNEKIQTKLSKNIESAKVKTETQNYKEWQKQVFGEANTRSSTKAIDDLTKQMKTSTNQGILDNADNWKDKSRLALTNETMERNFTDIMGKDAQPLKDKLIEPIFKAEADRTRFLNKERADIKALGIKPRSQDSALLQQYGEKKITLKELKAQSPNADKIVNAEKVLSQKYDTYLTELNKVLTRNGYDPIPKRQDYFHHFEQLNGIFDQVGVSIKATDLPTDINGLSADFKPGKNFFTAALQRKGDTTAVDAITGIDKYLEGASKQMYLTDSIQKLRSFETAIREKYTGTTHLSNFAADLTEYTNALAGKKAMLDRSVESLVGRKIYAGADILKKQTGSNMVGFNVASAVTNTIPIVETLATTEKVPVAQAMLNIFKNTFKDDGFIEKSNFLTNRVGSDRLSLSAWEKAQGAGFWIFKTIDNFTSQLVVRSKYLEGIKNGLSEESAMKAADSWGRKLLAGRTAGEMPTLYNSKTAGLLTQFQLEVNNQMSFMSKDIPRNFSKAGAASALAQLFIYSYIYNNIYEKMFGRRPAIDPIGVGVQTYEDYTNPDMKKGQATKNLVGNLANQLPYVSTFTGGGRIPVSAAIPNPLAVINGESTIGKEIMKPVQYLLPPTGGGQAGKTISGIKAFSQGASTTDAGNVRYPIPQTPTNMIRTAVAGQYSTPEAKDYFREGRTPLGANQSQEFLQMDKPDAQNYYGDVIKTRQSKAEEKRVDEAFMAGGDSLAVTGKIYRYNDSGELKKIDTNKVSSMPESTNYQKALKEKEAYKLVDNIMDSGLKPEEKQQALQDLGINAEDASYYNIAKQTNDIKNIYIQDEIGRITAGSNNRADLLNYLVTQRKEVNGDMVLANGVVDQLYQDEIITKDEANKLKAISVKNGVTKTKLSGRGKKVTFKKIQAPPASTKIKAKAYTMAQLLAKSGKTKIRTKKYNFTKKI